MATDERASGAANALVGALARWQGAVAPRAAWAVPDVRTRGAGPDHRALAAVDRAGIDR